MRKGKKMEVESETIEWKSIALVPARVANSRISKGAEAKSGLDEWVRTYISATHVVEKNKIGNHPTQLEN